MSPQSLALSSRGSHRRVGALPSHGFPRAPRYYGPVRLLAGPRASTTVLCARSGCHPHQRGLPCSACVCHRVPSLLPRGSASVHRLSTLSRDVRPSRVFQTLGLPISADEATSGFAARYGPRFCSRAVCRPSDILVSLRLDASRHHVGDRATQLLSSSSGWAPLIPQDTGRLHGTRKTLAAARGLLSRERRCSQPELDGLGQYGRCGVFVLWVSRRS